MKGDPALPAPALYQLQRAAGDADNVKVFKDSEGLSHYGVAQCSLGR